MRGRKIPPRFVASGSAVGWGRIVRSVSYLCGAGATLCPKWLSHQKVAVEGGALGARRGVESGGTVVQPGFLAQVRRDLWRDRRRHIRRGLTVFWLRSLDPDLWSLAELAQAFGVGESTIRHDLRRTRTLLRPVLAGSAWEEFLEAAREADCYRDGAGI